MILDTSVLIAIERGTERFDALSPEDDTAIAAVSIAELAVGVALSRGAARGRRQERLEAIEREVLIVPYDSEVARIHAALIVASRHQGRPKSAHDLIIAATAMATRRSVVTADTRGFSGLPGVDVVVWPETR